MRYCKENFLKFYIVFLFFVMVRETFITFELTESARLHCAAVIQSRHVMLAIL